MRRRLHNQVQELKGNIRVFCRVRPFLPGEQTASNTAEYANFDFLSENDVEVMQPNVSHTSAICVNDNKY